MKTWGLVGGKLKKTVFVSIILCKNETFTRELSGFNVNSCSQKYTFWGDHLHYMCHHMSKMSLLICWLNGKLLRNRVTLHKEQIKHEKYRQLKVSEHLAKCSNESFNIIPIYKCENTTRLFRDNKKQDIIKFLRPELDSSYH